MNYFCTNLGASESLRGGDLLRASGRQNYLEHLYFDKIIDLKFFSSSMKWPYFFAQNFRANKFFANFCAWSAISIARVCAITERIAQNVIFKRTCYCKSTKIDSFSTELNNWRNLLKNLNRNKIKFCCSQVSIGNFCYKIFKLRDKN